MTNRPPATSDGRTSWHARDAAHHDRELVVELVDEFGPAGGYIDAVLRDLAGQQKADGSVKTGFRSLAKKVGISPEECRRIMAHGARIGLFDDMVVADDGRRFTCRASGFGSDQARGTAAFKKADHRARAKARAEALSPSQGDMSTPEGDVSPHVPARAASTPETPAQEASTTPASTANGSSPHPAPIGDPEPVSTSEGDMSPHVPLDKREEIEEELLVGDAAEATTEVDPEVRRLSHLLADLICKRDPKAKAKVKPDSDRWLTAIRLLIADRGGDVAEVEAVLRWSQSDAFWAGNILSPPKLRDKFVQLVAQRSRGNGNGTPAGHQAVRERRGAALQSLISRTDPDQEGDPRAAAA